MKKFNLGPSYCQHCNKITEHFRVTNYPCSWVLYVGYVLWPLLPLALIHKSNKECCTCGISSDLSEEDKRNFNELKRAGFLDNNGCEYLNFFRTIGEEVTMYFNQNGDVNLIENVTKNIYHRYYLRLRMPYDWYSQCVHLSLEAFLNDFKKDEIMSKY